MQRHEIYLYNKSPPKNGCGKVLGYIARVLLYCEYVLQEAHSSWKREGGGGGAFSENLGSVVPLMPSSPGTFQEKLLSFRFRVNDKNGLI